MSRHSIWSGHFRDMMSKCLLSIGPTHAASYLANTLKSQTDLEVVLRRSTSAKSESATLSPDNRGSVGRCKLAIVGMAGRFPDAASHQALWELLERGLDVHREVPKDRFDSSFDLRASSRNSVYARTV